MEKFLALVFGLVFVVAIFLLNAYLLQMGYNGSVVELFGLPKASFAQAVYFVLFVGGIGTGMGVARNTFSSKNDE